MSDLAKVKLAQVFFSLRFWIATFILFFTEQGFSLTEVYVVVGIYYVASLLLEYPTGVIGDYYSHRLSVGWGYVIMGVSYSLFFFSGGWWYYLGLLLLAALGQALISGSDTALLHSVSKDFKKDFADLSTWCLIAGFIAITVGGVVAVYDLRYPILLSAAALFLAALAVWSLKDYTFEREKVANIFSFGKDALKVAYEDGRIVPLLLLGATVSGFFFSFKWFYNPIFEAIQLPLVWWGFFAGVAVLFTAFGTKLYRYLTGFSFSFLLVLLAISLAGSGAITFPIVVGIGFMVSHIARGYFETKITVEVNEILPTQYRASIISLKGVVLRIITGTYVFVAALTFKFVSLSLFMGLVGGIILFGGFICLWKYQQATPQKGTV